jgi:hypothetical protein
MASTGRSLFSFLQRQLKQFSIGAEVGVWEGQTAETLLALKPDLVLHMIDPWESGDSKSTMLRKVNLDDFAKAEKTARDKTERFKPRSIIHRMNSLDAAKLFDDGFFDFVFIDAEHTYEHVLQDVRTWYPKVRAGGILCGHDYGGRGDKTGRFQVKKAVDFWANEVGANIQKTSRLIWWTQIP